MRAPTVTLTLSPISFAGRLGDGRQVRRISAYLVEGDLDESPARLAANAGKAFIGDYICGSGFTFDDIEAARGSASSVAYALELIALDPKYKGSISPYVGGAEVNNHPRHSHSRWVFNLEDFPLCRTDNVKRWSHMTRQEQSAVRGFVEAPLDYPFPVAGDYPHLLEIAERLVKPERIRLPPKNTWNRTIAKFWWRWGAFRKGLHSALDGVESVWFHANLGPIWPFPNCQRA
jgi:hypothetical protein